MLLPALALLCSGSLAGPFAGSPSGEQVRLFVGATFHTSFDESEKRDASAVLVRDGRIVAVGSEATISTTELGRSAERIDLGGGHVYPGFQDAHGHLESYGASLEEVDLWGCESYDELVQRMREAATSVPAGRWIVGRGWDQSLWEGGAFPTHDALSRAVPEHPVVAWRVDETTIVVNRRAMAAAGIDGATVPKDPAGGSIGRAEDGRASGLLRGTAIDLVTRAHGEPDEATRVRRILRAQDALFAYGITCLHDMGTRPDVVPILRGLREDGRLRLRVVCYLNGDLVDDAADYERCLCRDARDVLTVAGVEFELDGGLGSRGAALLADYADAPGERGLLRAEPDALIERVAVAVEAGFQPALSAIGDRANRVALDTFERLAERYQGFSGLGPRLECAQVLSPAELPRLRELRVLASMQPVHLATDVRWAEARLGRGRLASAYAWRSVDEATTEPLAFGSDVPVEPPDVRAGLRAALTRQALDGTPKAGCVPSERLGAKQALAAYTQGPAIAARQGDRRGRIAMGYMCDLTVVDIDLTKLDVDTANRALDAKILATVVNGDVVFNPD